MVETSLWVRSDDGTGLFMRRWQCGASAPRGVVHLVHGMAEHSLRYRFLAERLGACGFELWAADMRGHGKTADPAHNDPGRGGLLGHTSDSNGFFRVVEDIKILSREVRKTCSEAYGPGLPLFLMGHSWGSFLVQGCIENLGDLVLDGCILSGTRGPGGPAITLGAPFLKLVAALSGCRRASALAYALADGAYSKPFRPNRTAFDWLSRDAQAVDAYISDPLCGQRCSSGFYRDMIGGLKAIHRREVMKNIPRELPVYIFCGSADPVGEMGAGPTKLVNAYRADGMTDLEFVIYPDARHELLNETNREEAAENLISWLLRHCPENGEKPAERV